MVNHSCPYLPTGSSPGSSPGRCTSSGLFGTSALALLNCLKSIPSQYPLSPFSPAACPLVLGLISLPFVACVLLLSSLLLPVQSTSRSLVCRRDGTTPICGLFWRSSSRSSRARRRLPYQTRNATNRTAKATPPTTPPTMAPMGVVSPRGCTVGVSVGGLQPGGFMGSKILSLGVVLVSAGAR